MFKAVLACALIALISAQVVQDLGAQANEAVAPVLGQENAVAQHGDSLSLVVNDYEWVITEQDGEFALEVSQLANNANNLAPTLAALLANVGNVAQSNNNELTSILNAEAAAAGIDVEDNGALATAASQYGAQLSENAEGIAAAAESAYNQAASALAENTNGIADQVNQQANGAVQGQDSVSSAVNSGVNAALANAEGADLNNLNNLASNAGVQVNGADASSLQNAAVNAAGNTDVNQASANLQGLANEALAAGQNAANVNLPGNVASGVNQAANNAAGGASNTLSTAAGTLNADAVNNAAAAANLVNGN